MSNLLEYREEQATQLTKMQENLNDLAEKLIALPEQDSAYKGRKSDELRDEAQALAEKIGQRLKRVKQDTCRVAVVGEESQGKSSFINAWIGEAALPYSVEACTWAATRIINSPERKAVINFYSRLEFDEMIDSYFKQLEISRRDVKFPFTREFLDGPIAEKCENIFETIFKELRLISEYYDQISGWLDKREKIISDSPDFTDKIYEYIALRSKDGETVNSHVYAVKSVDVYFPLKSGETKFSMQDLPGIGAPGKRAQNITERELRETADVIIFVKNPLNDSSLVGTEERLLEKASKADGAIKLKDRIFIILTHADDKKISHDRDAHSVTKNKFLDKKIPHDKIFFCSSAAEREDPEAGMDNPEKKKESMERIARLFSQTEPTTGFPEFKIAIEDFIENELPKLEKKAFNDLKDAYNSILKEIKDAAAASRVSSSAAITDLEVEHFDKLWGNDKDTECLSFAIVNAFNSGFRDECLENDENRLKLLKCIQENLARIKNKFIENRVNQETYDKYKYRHPISDLQTEQSYFRTQIIKELKETLYNEALPQMSAALKGQIENIWAKMKTASTKSAKSGLAAIPEADIVDFMTNHCKDNTPIFREIVTSQQEPSAFFESGFGALFRSILFAPLEYMSSPDSQHESTQRRILQKAILSKRSLDYIEKNIFPDINFEDLDSNIQDNNKNIDILGKLLQNKAIREIIISMLPTPVNIGLRILTETIDSAEKKQPTTEHSEKKFKISQNVDKLFPEVNSKSENYIEWMQSRVKSVFNVLEAMLFDYDFGIMGYYLSQSEQFRLEAETELDNSLKSLARCYRSHVWPDEAIFSSSKEREYQQKIAEKIMEYPEL